MMEGLGAVPTVYRETKAWLRPLRSARSFPSLRPPTERLRSKDFLLLAPAPARPRSMTNLAILRRERMAVGWVICSFLAISRAPRPSARQSRMAFSRIVRDLERRLSNSLALIWEKNA